MKVSLKTADLIGPALDCAVSVAHKDVLAPVSYSRQWQFGGPIIEQERIAIRFVRWDDRDGAAMPVWSATRGTIEAEGYSPLVAAMRCYVSAHLGDEVVLEHNEGSDDE